nr:DUF3592 domain-containing protein [Armatimonadota bacterium]
CAECGTTNGPEAVYCTECGVPGSPAPPEEPDHHVTLAQAPLSRRSTLVGSSSGAALALPEGPEQRALAQPLPRKVKISRAGWTALVGGWPELSISLVIAPMVAYGIILATRGFIGFGGSLVAAVGIALFLVLALLFGMGDTSRTLQGYRLARRGYAAHGEITRRVARKSQTGSTFYLEFTFMDSRGVHQSGRHEVTAEQWQAAAERQPVTILYNPLKPEDCSIYELIGVLVIPPALPAAGEGQ